MCLDSYHLGAFTTESNSWPNSCPLRDSTVVQRLLKRTRTRHLSQAGPPKTGPRLLVTVTKAFLLMVTHNFLHFIYYRHQLLLTEEAKITKNLVYIFITPPPLLVVVKHILLMTIQNISIFATCIVAETCRPIFATQRFPNCNLLLEYFICKKCQCKL